MWRNADSAPAQYESSGTCREHLRTGELRMRTPKNIAEYDSREGSAQFLESIAKHIREQQDDAVFLVTVNLRKWRTAWTDDIERRKASKRSKRSTKADVAARGIA
jgi:hypothetical protein